MARHNTAVMSGLCAYQQRWTILAEVEVSTTRQPCTEGLPELMLKLHAYCAYVPLRYLKPRGGPVRR
jgi:hypothetical protein